MSDSAEIGLLPQSKDLSQKLPISSMVRAVCEAATQGPERLYEVMMKMSLMVEATTPTYGLSIWAASPDGKPRLHWAEGLEENEISEGQGIVESAFTSKGLFTSAKVGDAAICLILSLPSPSREGAALYGYCAYVRIHPATVTGAVGVEGAALHGHCAAVVIQPAAGRPLW